MPTPGAEPYAPNLVPQTILGAEPTAQLADLERYLSEELERIATAMTFVPVQAAYCSLLAVGTQPDQPLGVAPQRIESFDQFAPALPNRVIPEFSPDQMVIEEGGVYLIQIFFTATVDVGAEYTLEVRIDGIGVDIKAAVDTSNQSDVINLSAIGIRELNSGNAVWVDGAADAVSPGPHTFIVESSTLAITRVSELHGRNASAIP